MVDKFERNVNRMRQVAKGKPVSEASVDFRSYLNENYPPIIPDSECPK